MIGLFQDLIDVIRDHMGWWPKPVVRPSVPLEMAGKWIAWSADGMRIIASADTLAEVQELARSQGETVSAFERIPFWLRRGTHAPG